MNKQEAWQVYLKSRPATATEQDDFEAGWDIAIQHAAELVDDFVDENSFYRAGHVIRRVLA